VAETVTRTKQTKSNPAPNGKVKLTKGKKYQNFIAGKWCDAETGETFDNRNPADTNDLIGTFPLSSTKDVDRAVKSAKKAFEWWRKVPAPEKGKLFFKLGEVLRERKEQYSFDMTREMGKPIFETRGDVQEAIDTADYAIGECKRMFGHTVPSELPNKFNMTIRFPIGVAGLITPWNFPMAIPSWKTIPCLACGNTFVIKPAQLTPLSVNNLIEAMLDAGFPPEVMNIVHGGGSHKDTNLVSFTGSSAVGRMVGEVGGRMLKRTSMELGGKNAQIVLNDANIEMAVDAAIWGGFGTTGQRCTATSRVIIEEGIHDEFVAAYVKAAKKLRLGYGNDKGITMGPAVSEGQRQTDLNYVKIGVDEGAELMLGGKKATGKGLENGFFIQPTIFTGVTPKMRIAQEEIFGPVVSIIKVKYFDEAIKVCNDIEYGLSSAVFTQDINKAYVAFRDIECGLTYINASTIGAEAHMPFGGMKATGNGHREGGWEAYEFYSETKACYVDYSGTMQRAQIDNY
jgi:aldehyde dehydrogenase (NAD+)